MPSDFQAQVIHEIRFPNVRLTRKRSSAWRRKEVRNKPCRLQNPSTPFSFKTFANLSILLYLQLSTRNYLSVIGIAHRLRVTPLLDALIRLKVAVKRSCSLHALQSLYKAILNRLMSSILPRQWQMLRRRPILHRAFCTFCIWCLIVSRKEQSSAILGRKIVLTFGQTPSHKLHT